MQPSFRASFLAALPGGLVILLAFFVWHWFTIAPVWSVLPEGALGVAIVGAGVAWAWSESRAAGRFAGPWGGLAFGGLFAAGVLLAEAIGLARGAIADPTTVREVAVQLPFALLPVAVVTFAGWKLAGTRRAAAGFGIASLVLLLYLGGTVMAAGGVGLGLGLFAILVPGYLAAGALLGFLQPRLER